MRGYKRLFLLILLHFGLEINLSETNSLPREDTRLLWHTICHENLFAGKHTVPRYSLPIQGCALIANGSHPGGIWPFQGQGERLSWLQRLPQQHPALPSQLPCQIASLPWHETLNFTTHNVKAENHTNEGILGLCKMHWDYDRYTKSKPVNYSNSRQWFYSIAAQTDLVLMVWKVC